MGKMKDIMIDKMNDEGPKYDSAGFTHDDNQMKPPPDEINLESGLSMWVINDIRVWARSYMEACKLYEIIDKF